MTWILFPFQVPYLQLEIQDDWNLRPRRTLRGTCQNGGNDGQCCMDTLKVDFFKDFEWDFVIFPKSFTPNFCVGECQLGKILPESNHAHVLLQSGLSPCCNAQKMDTLELLYMDPDNNVVQGTLPNMIVKRCGCA